MGGENITLPAPAIGKVGRFHKYPVARKTEFVNAPLGKKGGEEF